MARWVPWGGRGGRPELLYLPVRDCLLYVREESRKEEGEEKRREREKKRREEKKAKNFQTWKFPEKIKDNL
jgi:hypothetical protein